jgi:hypothetical protein
MIKNNIFGGSKTSDIYWDSTWLDFGQSSYYPDEIFLIFSLRVLLKMP